jgi:aminopeptidase-like protein
MRSVWGSFPEYHTSADNLDFVKPQQLAGALRVCAAIVDVLENNGSYQNLSPFCEPQLGRRGLYRPEGTHGIEAQLKARLWVLNLSDGKHSLLDIAERSKLPFELIADAAELLCEVALLSKIPDESKY